MGEIVAVVVSVVTLGGRGLLGLIVLLGILVIVGGLEVGGILIFVGLDVLIIGLLLADVVLNVDDTGGMNMDSRYGLVVVGGSGTESLAEIDGLIGSNIGSSNLGFFGLSSLETMT